MDNIILTNNPKVISAFSEVDCWGQLICKETHEEILWQCEYYLSEDWHFASDPLGGYHFRPNLYHTIFFTKEETAFSREPAKEWTILESMKLKYYQHKPFLERYSEPRHQRDYQVLDYTIAERVMQILKETSYH